MNIRTLLIGLLIFGQLSCSNNDDDIHSFKDKTSISSINGIWKVISYENYTTNTREFKNQENSTGLDIIITFDDSQEPHKFFGKNTTNSVFGEFEYLDTRVLKILNFGTTEIAQPEWGNKFNEVFMESELNFKINNNGLRIFYDNNTKSVTLTKE
ncbi:MAG: hypothetical protein IPM42_13700 [Saprospiraceae bacterium]|nr:hypothetical protein [Saprospiraceae bacterium]